MTTVELKRILKRKITQINDVSLLNSLNTILEPNEQIYTLTPEQRQVIIESQKEIEQGLFFTQEEIDQEFQKWLEEK
jgi:hypothetical protein